MAEAPTPIETKPMQTPIAKEQKPASPAVNTEVFSRKISGSNEDKIFQSIAKSKNESIRLSSLKGTETVIDKKIASLGYLLPLKSGDNFDPPLKISHNGKDYAINTVGGNEGALILREGQTSINLNDIITGFQKEITDELKKPDYQNTDNINIKFIKNYLDNKGAVEKNLLIEAATENGFLTRNEMIDWALRTEIITNDEALILKGEKPATEQTEENKPINLTEKANKLQEILKSDVLDRNQTKQALEILGLPYSAESIDKIIINNEIEMSKLKIVEQSLKEGLSKSPKNNEIIEAIADNSKKILDLHENSQEIIKAKKILGENKELGGNWDMVDKYYDLVENGNLKDEKNGVLPALLEATKTGDYNKVLDIIDPITGNETHAELEAKKQKGENLKKKLIKIGTVGGGLLAGLAALQIFMGLTKKER